MSRATVVIPARLNSRRLPRKVLADISGLPMVVHVMRRAALARGVGQVVVATADEEVKRVVEAHGGRTVQTHARHTSGSDRVAEAAESLNLGADDFIVNVQADEPMLDPSHIDGIIQKLEAGAEVATAAAPLEGKPEDPSVVKVVTDPRDFAIYFSRTPIPTGGPWFQHIGIYGFRADALRRFTRLPPGRLEKLERLEQLRMIENGMSIQVVAVREAGLSIDTPDDLAIARTMMARTVLAERPPSLLESSSLD